MEANYAEKWIEINRDQVVSNLQAVKSLVNEGVTLIAVVKANAYGHGLKESANILYANGVNYFAVSYLQEALEIRNSGIPAAVLIFAPLIDEAEIRVAIANHFTLTVASLYDCRLLEKVSDELGLPVQVHVKMETGLARFGVEIAELTALCQRLNNHKNIDLEGIYTHMADAGNEAYTQKQFNLFMAGVAAVENTGIKISMRHCANSTIFLKYPAMHLDAVRVGTLLSGQYPAGQFPKTLKIADPYKFKTRIVAIKTLGKGSFLGYKRTYKLKSPAQIAVIPIGYVDGLAVDIVNRPENFWDLLKKLLKNMLAYFNVPRFSLQVRIRGKLYYIRGKVFMQMALLEIPLDTPLMVGEEVEVPIRKTLARDEVKRIYISEVQSGKEVFPTYMTD